MLNSRHILVVDDSSVARQTLRELLEWEGATVDLAEDPYAAVKRLKLRLPDAIVLDLEMPSMSGLVFLRKLMSQHPLPVVVVSGMAEANSEAAFQAMEAGAVEVVAKPGPGDTQSFETWRLQTISALERAISVGRRPAEASRRRAPCVPARPETNFPLQASPMVIAIGASTGGTRALADFLGRLPADCPGLVIVQHLPAAFTAPFAHHLDSVGPVRVKEAATGDLVATGRALVAPGGHHLLLLRKGTGFVVEVREGPSVNRHRPSVDVLFKSTAQSAGARAVGVILTGMGDDGARCLKEMRDAGAKTFAQDEATCVVFGMPKEAIRLGGVEHVLPLAKLPEAVLRAARCPPLVSKI